MVLGKLGRGNDDQSDKGNLQFQVSAAQKLPIVVAVV